MSERWPDETLSAGTGECDRVGWQHNWCNCNNGGNDPYHCANCGKQTYEPRAAEKEIR